MPGQKYGLILPSKKKPQPATRVLNPLVESDEELEKDEENLSLNWVEESLKKSAGNSGQKSLQKRLLREAYEEDATVFQYDEVYDDMKASQHEERTQKQKSQQKCKYIETILKHTERRKLENERRQDRKVQKEREAEGNEFKDKESFVTSSYLKKLEEIKKAEEEEKVEKYIEEHTDVHKHKNFGVFYNHIFQQRMGEADIKKEPVDTGEEHGKSTTLTVHTERRKKNYRTQEDLSDEETPILNKKIKKEVRSSDSEQETNSRIRTDRSQLKENINSDSSYKEMPRRLSDRSRSPYKKDRSKSRNRDSIRDKGREIEDRIKDTRKETDAQRGNRDKYKNRHKDLVENEQSNDISKGSRHDRHSRDKHRSRSRDRDRYSMDKDRQNRSKDRSQNKEKESEHRNRRSEERRETDSSRRDRSSNKENDNADEVKVTSKDKSEAKKQTINNTLGLTDVNKMNMEERIKRFTEIFAKKTVGQEYEESVLRYFQRKSEREAKNLL